MSVRQGDGTPNLTADTTEGELGTLTWDPYDVALDRDPYPTWRRMRDEAPLYRNEARDFWALSRYDDVRAASADPETFISGKGTVLEVMGTDLTTLRMLLFLDPPDHDVLRSLVSRAFTPRRIASLGGAIQGICEEYLDPQIGSGGFDFVTDFGAHLPSRVISEILGVPRTDQPRMLELINLFFDQDPEGGFASESGNAARLELREWLVTALAERRKTPTDDMLSDLVVAEIETDDGRRRLDQDELLGFGTVLVAAGTETVAKLLGWAAVVLADHPAQQAELAADKTLIPGAIEELLRYEAPVPVQGRTVAREVVMHDQVLGEGARVLLINGSAGRDERVYPDPDRFDIHRTFDRPHQGFGVGVHYCLGAALARLEGRIALEETMRRFPSWNVDPAGTRMLHTSTVRGYQNVAITI